MSAENSPHRRNRSVPYSIPLQDLNRPEDDSPDSASSGSHRRTLSERGRDLFQHSRNSILRRDQHGVGYAPVIPESSRQASSASSGARAGLGLSTGTDVPSRFAGQDTSYSSIAPSFRDADGFSPVPLHDADSPSGTPSKRTKFSILPVLKTSWMDGDKDSEFADEDDGDATGAFPSERDMDTAPLTHSPRSGYPASPNMTPSAHKPSRSLFPGTNFLTPNRHDPEQGTGTSPKGKGKMRSNSLLASPLECPLRRAGTVMKNLSQRVVNISNEPEVAEKNIKRTASLSHSVPPSPNPSRPTSQHVVAANDGTFSIASPLPEKLASPVHVTEFPELPERPQGKPANPLRGRSLEIFGPDNRLRLWLLDVLTHPVVEPTILVLIILQAILQIIDNSSNIFDGPQTTFFEGGWINLALLTLFSIYTAEMAAKIIVSGFIMNPLEYSTINRNVGFWPAVTEKIMSLFSVTRGLPVKTGHDASASSDHPAPFLRNYTTMEGTAHYDSARQAARRRLAHRAFLRHSFNRLDFLAVVSYWIGSFMTSHAHLNVFKMLSCLRVLRLLGMTGGTLVILRSLKRAAPILLNVAFLIGFFWLLFGIVGVQSFKSSLRRYCCWTDYTTVGSDPWPGYNQSLPGSYQFCGGWLDANGTEQPYLKADGTYAWDMAKGYICPMNSVCIESTNPYNNTVSFDNLPQSLELVFVIMTSNTFTDIMYYLTDANYLIVALFFAMGILFLTLWLLNLLIAVITSSFQIIREESRTSAFAAEHDANAVKPDDDAAELASRRSSLQRWHRNTRWVWIAIIVYGLIAQGFKSATMSAQRATFISHSETIVTLLLDLEIIIRFAINWRHFFKSKTNMADLFLAVVTSIIQIPFIHNSGRAYAWLTIFQILRVYRVVIFVKAVRELIQVVLGNTSGLGNLILFVFLLTFLAAIFAAQLFRGVLPTTDNSGNPIQTPFFSYWNSFLGMYQILSSENWTTMLYNVTAYQVAYRVGWIGATFLILWYILSNFIVLNMFIAVIQENFDVSEDEKRLQQVKAFLRQKRSVVPTPGVLSISSLFRSGRDQRQTQAGFTSSAARELLLKDAVVKEFLDEQNGSESPPPRLTPAPTQAREKDGPGRRALTYIKERILKHEPNPFHSKAQFTTADEDVDPRTMAQEVYKADDRRRQAQRDYLKKHPNYDRVLFMLRPRNPIRRFCQMLVGPSSGDQRLERPAPKPVPSIMFSILVYAAIVAMVILACITTPLYQKEYFSKHSFTRTNWFTWVDLAFAAFFTVETIIKIIADGFYFTPNAYFRGAWGRIDGIVLITLWINAITLFVNPGSGSRTVGAFKALRALRLLNVSHGTRDTFHSVMITGAWKIGSAAVVSLSLLIPFALYGLNLFNGQMMLCNDNQDGLYNLTDCVGEWMSSPYEWNVLAPKQVNNKYYSFDDFGQSLFILFQIVSQEGWIDVMWSAQGITGIFTQPQYYAGEGNSVFFVVFNLLGAVFVLTLFVSVFMRNYTEQTGVAFLTVEQRSWLELRKLLRQVSPTKRPMSLHPRKSWQDLCYKMATNRKGWWHKTITWSLIIHLILLCLEWYPDETWWPSIRLCFFLALTLIFLMNVIVRIIGRTWRRYIRSAWDVYNLLAVTALVINTCVYWEQPSDRDYDVVYKINLVAMALLLIPRNDQLDQLFKTAAASLSAIVNLLATWFVLFLVFAIALTQTFGLTRFGPNGLPNLNFRTTPKALIFLFRTSMGEGWNQLMHDYATIEPPFCTLGDAYYEGDCGSEQWAQGLFVLWNIISMYIFVNLFVSLIYESFSYVYQRNNGLSVISREEIRRFKQAWSEHDPAGAGYISKQSFPRLLADLNGIFEMRIYDGDYTVRRILDLCTRPSTRRMTQASVDDVGGLVRGPIDLKLLNAHLAEMPIEEIRRRRQRMNTFYEEVLVSADSERGIEFTTLLLIIAHYKIIIDSRSLRLEEFLQRRVRLQRIDEAVQRNIVIGFFDTLYWSRRFRARINERRNARMSAIPTHDFAVPEIVVQDEMDSPHALDETPKTPTVHVTDEDPFGQSVMGRGRSLSANSAAFSFVASDGESQASPKSSPTRNNRARSPSEAPEDSRWHLSAALSTVSDDSASETGRGRALSTGGLQPRDSPSGSRERGASVSHQDMLNVLDNSAWGESIRRTYTVRDGKNEPSEEGPHNKSS